MASSSTNIGAPPPYEETNSSPPGPPPHATKTRNGIPPQTRRSMEDEHRSLPQGWIRQYDRQSHHQFFVDTNIEPPRSIWHHPYDDDEYLSTLSPAEKSKIQKEGLTLQRHPSMADIEVESSDDDHDDGLGNSRGDVHGPGGGTTTAGTGEEHIGATHRFGRKMKDKMTHTTHAQREEKRRQRAEAERRAYAQHQHFRAAMTRAEETGEPQLLGKDKDGKEVYIEPSYGVAGQQGGGGGFYGDNGYGVNPYSQGTYANPNARFVRPQGQYYRPYGYGYGGGGGFGGGGYGYGGGGGFGLPLAAGLGTGLLLGDMFWM